MIEYVMDYLENSGVIFSSREELAEVTGGVRLYLAENGVPEQDDRAYFRKYLNRSLARIDRQDLKRYFMAYTDISAVKQICIEFYANGGISEERKKTLLRSMSALYTAGLGGKYIPAVEVNAILGRWA